MCIEKKIEMIRFKKKFGFILYGSLFLTLIIMGVINLDSELKIQASNAEKTSDSAVKITQSTEVMGQPINIAEIEQKQFTITHYCSCNICCGKSDGITATGTIAKSGRTIAVDPDVITLGSVVLIDGIEYVAEDVGGAIKGNRIDIYCDSHTDAINRGRCERDIVIR